MRKQEKGRHRSVVNGLIAVILAGVPAIFTNAAESTWSTESNSHLNNLQGKWRDSFNFLDIKRDGVLDMADIKLIQDNYVRLHNLTTEEGVFPAQRILVIWKQVVFRGEIGALTKSEYVRSCTEAYEANPDVYIRGIKAAYTDLMSLFDVNENKMMEIEEHVRFFKMLGFTSDNEDLTAFKVAYRNTDSVPLEVVVDMWVHFRTDTTTNAKNDTIDQAIRTVSHEEL